MSEITLRPTVVAFAVAMERKLRKHDDTRGHRGWEGDYATEIWSRVMDEFDELKEAYAKDDVPGMVSEAADVANFLMMLLDVQEALPGDGRELELNETKPRLVTYTNRDESDVIVTTTAHEARFRGRMTREGYQRLEYTSPTVRLGLAHRVKCMGDWRHE